MIWESMFLMTAFDLAIFGLSAASFVIIFRHRNDLRKAGVMTPVTFIIAAITLLGLFYFTDLVTMWVMPPFIGMDAAMERMQSLHLNFSWVNNLVIAICIFVGLVLGFRKLLAQAQVLELANEHLDTELKHRKELLAELQKLNTAIRSSYAGIVITDTQGIIEYINPSFTATYGYIDEEVIGEPIDLLRYAGKDSKGELSLAEMIERGEIGRGNRPHRRKDGSLQWDRINLSSVKDEQGQITNYIVILEDNTREYEVTERLNYQARHDELTGLINRYEFDQRLRALLSDMHESGGNHALCFMDLDQFKLVNDTCGHAAGDEMLKQITQVLMASVRKSDVLARLGGDEFGLLMTRCTPVEAERVAQNLQRAVNDFHFRWDGQNFKVGVSIGLIPVDDPTLTISTLMKRADAACYVAKDMGRNRIHTYSAEDEVLAKREGEMQWVSRIYDALDQNRFVLFAQPIVPSQSGANRCYEILLRLRDDSKQLISAAQFLPAAERYDLAFQIDQWVVTQALQQLEQSPDFLEQVDYLSLNLSGQSIANEKFQHFLVERLQETSVPGNKICFEITETAAIANLAVANKFMMELKKQGCRFALDDFGSGLSSFAYLKNLPVDYLKIDGMFVKDIADDPIDHAMVQSINGVAQVMGMKTIAEFVESDKISDLLQALGIDYLQGFNIGKPIALEEVIARSNNVVQIYNESG